MERKDIQSIWAAYQEVQEKKLKGDQHKLDMDKDGDIDATDFKHMRDKKKVAKEEAELDEAAPKMKGDWLKKEREKNREHDAAMGRTPTGRKKPVRSMTSTQKSLASMRNEEAEQIDEISKTKMGQYIKRAHADKDTQTKRAGIFDKKGMDADKDKDMYSAWDKANKARKKASNRTKFIGKAVDRLAKEETEIGEAKDPRQSNRGYQDPNDKGLSPGGKQMKADMQKGAKYDDTEEKGHQDAAKLSKKMKASPMRNNDNSQGDRKIIPSATKMKEAKTIDAFFRALFDKEGDA